MTAKLNPTNISSANAATTTPNTYKRMAGTSAVFVKANHQGSLPIERDGLTWSANELALEPSKALHQYPDMPSVLALEGLEDYQPPSDGDYRRVSNLNCGFTYIASKKAWIET